MRAREFSIRRIMCFLWISDYYNQMLRAGEKVWAFSARVKRTHAARASTHRKVERFLHEGQTPSFPSGANAERRWSPQKLTLQCGQVKIVLTVMPHRGQVCTPFIILKFSIFWSLQIQRTGRNVLLNFPPASIFICQTLDVWQTNAEVGGWCGRIARTRVRYDESRRSFCILFQSWFFHSSPPFFFNLKKLYYIFKV